MKKLIVVAIVLACVSSAEARHRSFGTESDYQSNGTFGLGLELGEPDGLNAKLFLNPSQALDFGIGGMYHHYYGGDGLNLYLDYLWHPKQLVATEAFKLPFYIGVGGRLWFFDYGPNDGRADVFGVRIPIGIDFDFNNVPLDIFVQLVPTFDFYRNYDQHDFYLDIDFSVGARFWFD